MLTLNWFYKDSNGKCYQLYSDQLSKHCSERLTGVYVIWRGIGIIPKAIYVGEGIIKNRLGAHRRDPRFFSYHSSENPLYVCWASVPRHSMDGVEKYLYEELTPLIGENKSLVKPITVNLPG